MLAVRRTRIRGPRAQIAVWIPLLKLRDDISTFASHDYGSSLAGTGVHQAPVGKRSGAAFQTCSLTGTQTATLTRTLSGQQPVGNPLTPVLPPPRGDLDQPCTHTRRGRKTRGWVSPKAAAGGRPVSPTKIWVRFFFWMFRLALLDFKTRIGSATAYYPERISRKIRSCSARTRALASRFGSSDHTPSSWGPPSRMPSPRGNM